MLTCSSPASQLETLQYKAALALIDILLAELKRLDDKMISTEMHLLESRVYRDRQPRKIKSSSPLALSLRLAFTPALTSSRTAANSIYCPPHLQAALDLQSGVLHAEEKGYTTAYSHFFETFENLGRPRRAERTQVCCAKSMLNLPEDVTLLLSIKLALKYAQLREVERILRGRTKTGIWQILRKCSGRRNILNTSPTELSSDPTIRSHLAALYDTLLEQNLLRIVEPYSRQGRQAVEAKLLQIRCSTGCLTKTAYGAAIDTLEQVGKVVDSLYAKTVKIA